MHESLFGLWKLNILAWFLMFIILIWKCEYICELNSITMGTVALIFKFV